MISIPEAQDIVLSQTQALPSVSVALPEAVDSTLAEDVHAPDDVPPFPASIKVCTSRQPCIEPQALLLASLVTILPVMLSPSS